MTDYDVIVVGGGPAGVGAAYMAAGCGAKTLLLERSGRLGGTAVQSVVGPLMGCVESLVVDSILERIGGHFVDFRRLDVQLYDLLRERGAEILLRFSSMALNGAGKRDGCGEETEVLHYTGNLGEIAEIMRGSTGDFRPHTRYLA